ncbi:hypothetical protein BJ742DRAFT_799804 [Cladochytrium replicatum]|nr:hypothetical protein BJ742DRAFT_799804 [Cladochytrium replicatum]
MANSQPPAKKQELTPKQKTVGFNPVAGTASTSASSTENRKSRLQGWTDDVALSQKFSIEELHLSSASTSSASMSTSPGAQPTPLKRGNRFGGQSRSPTRASYDDRLFMDIENRPIAADEDQSQIAEGEATSSENKQKGKQPQTIADLSGKHKGDKQKVKVAAAPLGEGDGQEPQKKSMKEMTKAERRELQEKQRAAKAAAKAGGPGPSARPNNAGNAEGGSSESPASSTTGPPSVSLSASSNTVATAPRTGAAAQTQRGRATKAVTQSIAAERPVPLFSHLDQFEKNHYRALVTKNQGVVHPAVMSLGLQYLEFVISGGNARAIAMLNTFRRVISDYETPPGTSLQRHLNSYISKQVDFLSKTRVLAVSMRTAVKFLKNEITNLPIEMPDKDAKEHLKERIDMFIRDRIVVADAAILNYGLEKIEDGDVIMTYARSSVVIQLLLKAKAEKIDFRVVIVDSRPKLEGKETLKQLVNAGIDCSYVLLNSVSMIMKQVTKVLVGASAVMSNGAVMSRIGTAVIAMVAHDTQIPLIVVCETYKFTEDVRVDSFVWNEIGNPDELADTRMRAPSTVLPGVVPSVSGSAALASQQAPLTPWRDTAELKLLNLHYDVTPAQYVTVVLSDAGWIPTSSVPTFVREIGPTAVY